MIELVGRSVDSDLTLERRIGCKRIAPTTTVLRFACVCLLLWTAAREGPSTEEVSVLPDSEKILLLEAATRHGD